MTEFRLSRASMAYLEGVHPRLVEVVDRAIELTTQDFMVTDGVRTLERQKELVASGASKTMNSRHLRQPDGWGHAVDLVPYLQSPRWEWPLIYPVAVAMRRASEEFGVELTWGGAWDRPLSSFNPTVDDMRRAVAEYTRRHPGPDFIDGPHYQLRKA